jgi:hypothetical protein
MSGDTNPYAYTNTYTDTNTDTYSDTDTNSYTYSDSDTNSYADSDSDTNSYADSDPGWDRAQRLWAQSTGEARGGSHLERGNFGQHRHLP